MPGLDSQAAVAQLAEPFGRPPLLVAVVAEGGEPVVVEDAGEVRDVGSEDEVSDPDRLMAGGVPGRAEKLDRAVAEEIVVAIEESEVGRGLGVVTGLEEVALDRRAVLTGFPLRVLDDDRHRRGEQRQAAGMVEMQVGEHHPGHGVEVDLIGDRSLLLQLEVGECAGLIMSARIGHGGGMQAGVDEDSLVLGLDQVGGHRDADRPFGLLFTLAPEASCRSHPADVQHFDSAGAGGGHRGKASYLSRVTPTLDELTVADAPGAWEALGFELDGDTCSIGDTRIRMVGREAGRGLTGWSLRDIEATELDGLATARSDRPPPGEPPLHPNGITALDHVVAITPDLDRSVATLQGAGLDLRRIRKEPTPAGAPRQAFFRLGTVILEVVQEPQEAIERGGGTEGPAFFWGLAFIAPDLDATVASLGDDVSEVRAAVQPGRRIATLRRSAGLAVPIALITPPPGSGC